MVGVNRPTLPQQTQGTRGPFDRKPVGGQAQTQQTPGLEQARPPPPPLPPRPTGDSYNVDDSPKHDPHDALPPTQMNTVPSKHHFAVRFELDEGAPKLSANAQENVDADKALLMDPKGEALVRNAAKHLKQLDPSLKLKDALHLGARLLRHHGPMTEHARNVGHAVSQGANDGLARNVSVFPNGAMQVQLSNAMLVPLSISRDGALQLSTPSEGPARTQQTARPASTESAKPETQQIELPNMLPHLRKADQLVLGGKRSLDRKDAAWKHDVSYTIRDSIGGLVQQRAKLIHQHNQGIKEDDLGVRFAGGQSDAVRDSTGAIKSRTADAAEKWNTLETARSIDGQIDDHIDRIAANPEIPPREKAALVEALRGLVLGDKLPPPEKDDDTASSRTSTPAEATQAQTRPVQPQTDMPARAQRPSVAQPSASFQPPSAFQSPERPTVSSRPSVERRDASSGPHASKSAEQLLGEAAQLIGQPSVQKPKFFARLTTSKDTVKVQKKLADISQLVVERDAFLAKHATGETPLRELSIAEILDAGRAPQYAGGQQAGQGDRVPEYVEQNAQFEANLLNREIERQIGYLLNHDGIPQGAHQELAAVLNTIVGQGSAQLALPKGHANGPAAPPSTPGARAETPPPPLSPRGRLTQQPPAPRPDFSQPFTDMPAFAPDSTPSSPRPPSVQQEAGGFQIPPAGMAPQSGPPPGLLSTESRMPVGESMRRAMVDSAWSTSSSRDPGLEETLKQVDAWMSFRDTARAGLQETGDPQAATDAHSADRALADLLYQMRTHPGLQSESGREVLARFEHMVTRM